jgi:hypothetical protein
MIFWLAFALMWKVLYPGRSRTTAQAQSPLLHERATHSFPSLFGLLLIPVMFTLVFTAGFLNQSELSESKMVLVFVSAVFVACYYFVRVARGLF